jgi:hypothetical protein
MRMMNVLAAAGDELEKWRAALAGAGADFLAH